MLRLRRRISLLFALTSAVGLVAMAVLAVRSDSGRWREQLDHTMDADTSWALGLLETDRDGRLVLDVLADSVDTACPPLTVLLVEPGAPGALRVEHAPAKPCLTVGRSVVQEAGRAAVRADGVRAFDGRTTDGEPVRVFAQPFYAPEAPEDAGPQGVLVTVADAGAPGRPPAAGVAGDGRLRGARPAVGGRRSRPVGAGGPARAPRARPAGGVPRGRRARSADPGRLAADARRDGAARRDGQRGRAPAHAAPGGGMGRLVDGLLTRARLMSGTAAVTRQPLRLDQLVEAVAEESAGAGGHRVRVEAAEAVVVADPISCAGPSATCWTTRSRTATRRASRRTCCSRWAGTAR
ncbi:sensor histidine kinase [Streptomyces diastatochromogenes]|nr:sensor histidine kinase [Streptomyces diastatochromogenes]